MPPSGFLPPFRTRVSTLGLGLGLCFGLAVSSAGCVSPNPLDNLPCPCAAGWACCADQNVCVPEGAACPEPSSLVTPGVGQVRFGGTLQLRAREPVTWSIEEGPRGGQITADGLYTAPLRPGLFHVLAAPIAHPERTVRVELAVGPTRLTVLAGRLGGAGQIDGTGPQARLGQMTGIVGDGAGHLYVTSNHGTRFSPESGSTPATYKHLGSVRRIDLKTAAVSTVAQVETEYETVLLGLTLDAQGQLYSTTGDRQVVRIDPKSGTVTTLVPATTPEVTLTGALAFVGGSLYFARSGTGVDIARLDPASGRVESVAGSLTEAGSREGEGADVRIRWIHSLVVQTSGALLFSDQPYPTVPATPCFLRKLEPTTRVVTTVSTLDACPVGLAMDARGLLYTARGNINAATGGEKELLGVRQVLKKSYPYQVSASWPVEGLTRFETQYSSPLYIEGDTIYAADNPHTLIRKIGPITTYPNSEYGTIATVSNLDTLLAGTQAWIGNSDGQGEVARFNTPKSVVTDSQGNLHVHESMRDYSVGRARVIAPDGTVRTTGGIASRVGLAVGPDNRLFSVTGDDRLYELTPMGRVLLPVKILDGSMPYQAFYLPHAMAADAQAVYVLDEDHPTGRRRIRRYDLATQELRTLTLLSLVPDYWNMKLAVDHAGNVFASTSTKIYRIHGVTGATTEINLGTEKLESITAFAYDPVGLFYIAEDQHIRVLVESTGEGFELIGQRGMVGVRPGPRPASLHGIAGLAVLPDGALVVSTSTENTILVAR